jgi:hypothetical protein
MRKIWYDFVFRRSPELPSIDVNDGGVGIILVALETELKLCYHSVGKLTQFVHQMSVFLEALSDFRSAIRNDFGMHLSCVMMDYRTNNARIIFNGSLLFSKSDDSHLFSSTAADVYWIIYGFCQEDSPDDHRRRAKTTLEGHANIDLEMLMFTLKLIALRPSYSFRLNLLSYWTKNVDISLASSARRNLKNPKKNTFTVFSIFKPNGENSTSLSLAPVEKTVNTTWSRMTESVGNNENLCNLFLKSI